MGAFVFDVDSSTFDRDVLARSTQTPVVVDFWAGWCGPCRQLGPALEAAVEARSGAVLLAKLDVDANQELAAAFGVQGIPMVLGFVGGRPVEQFVGVKPRAEIDAFLDRLVPSPADRLVAAAANAPAPEAKAAYQSVLEREPAHVGARIGLAAIELNEGDPAAALVTLRPVEYAEEAGQLLSRARLMVKAADSQGAYSVQAKQILLGQTDDALTALLEAVRVERGAQRDEARILVLDALHLLGPSDPRTARYRRDLSSALF